MEKGSGSGLFVNDGSFMERFKQLEKDSSSQVTSSVPPKPGGILGKRPPMPSGKLAFSLKQKSKIAVAPVKLGTDEDEGEDDGSGATKEISKRQMLGQPDPTELAPLQGDVAPSPPSDPAMRKVAEKLANFVAKNGRPYEHITRQRNPGDTPFKFLFDTCCSDYKYYEYRLLEEEKIIAQTKQSQTSHTVTPSGTTSRSPIITQRGSLQQHSDYQTPASALYGNDEDSASLGRAHTYGASSGPPSSDPIAMMEYYMKRAAQEERKRPPRQSKDEMPPPASLQAPVKKGHHMGDYIPPEELEKFFASCSDASSQKSSKEASEKAKIQADNIGHKLLSKMGWREGEGLGSDRRGRADPVMAGDVKKDHLGVGAQKPGEVNPEDDIYEQYKKRMMLGYRYRPNPLNNPRKSYY